MGNDPTQPRRLAARFALTVALFGFVLALVACARGRDSLYFRAPQPLPPKFDSSIQPPFPDALAGLTADANAEDVEDDVEADADRIGNDADSGDAAESDNPGDAHTDDDDDSADTPALATHDGIEVGEDGIPRIVLVRYASRDFDGVTAREVLEVLGAPHDREIGLPASPQHERWTYTFTPTPQTPFPERDVRTIGHQHPSFPRLAVRFTLDAAGVRGATVSWVYARSIDARVIRSLLGPPLATRPQIDTAREIWSYRYECLTETAIADGRTLYRLVPATVWLPVEDDIQAGGLHIDLGASASLKVAPDGSVENLNTTLSWRLRRLPEGELADIGLRGLNTATEVEFTFGRPGTVTVLVDEGDKRRVAWDYALKHTSDSSRPPLTLRIELEDDAVRQIRVIDAAGIPAGPADLQIAYGAPTNVDGPDLYGHERWTYRYLLQAKPPFAFGPERSTLQTPIRIQFEVRGGVRLDEMADLSKGRPRLIARGQHESEPSGNR